MKIAIGSDHAGFALKETLRRWLEQEGYEVTDCGTYSAERADYPVYGQVVGQAVAQGSVHFGVLVCGSGQGICMAANKVPGMLSVVTTRDWVATIANNGWAAEKAIDALAPHGISCDLIDPRTTSPLVAST